MPSYADSWHRICHLTLYQRWYPSMHVQQSVSKSLPPLVSRHQTNLGKCVGTSYHCVADVHPCRFSPIRFPRVLAQVQVNASVQPYPHGLCRISYPLRLGCLLPIPSTLHTMRRLQRALWTTVLMPASVLWL